MDKIQVSTSILGLLLVIGLFGLLVSTIILTIAVIKKEIKLLVLFPVIGIVLSVIPIILSLAVIFINKSTVNEVLMNLLANNI